MMRTTEQASGAARAVGSDGDVGAPSLDVDFMGLGYRIRIWTPELWEKESRRPSKAMLMSDGKTWCHISPAFKN